MRLLYEGRSRGSVFHRPVCHVVPKSAPGQDLVHKTAGKTWCKKCHLDSRFNHGAIAYKPASCGHPTRAYFVRFVHKPASSGWFCRTLGESRRIRATCFNKLLRILSFVMTIGRMARKGRRSSLFGARRNSLHDLKATEHDLMVIKHDSTLTGGNGKKNIDVWSIRSVRAQLATHQLCTLTRSGKEAC